MTTSAETRPEYLTDAELQSAYDDALEVLYRLDSSPKAYKSLSTYHEQQNAAEDRLLALATEMPQRYRFAKPVGPQPPLPADI